MKKLIIILISIIFLTGCGTKVNKLRVPKESFEKMSEYDKVKQIGRENVCYPKQSKETLEYYGLTEEKYQKMVNETMSGLGPIGMFDVLQAGDKNQDCPK